MKRPVKLADQLRAWALWRAGWCVVDIASTSGRLPSETRAILFGKAE